MALSSFQLAYKKHPAPTALILLWQERLRREEQEEQEKVWKELARQEEEERLHEEARKRKEEEAEAEASRMNLCCFQRLQENYKSV